MKTFLATALLAATGFSGAGDIYTSYPVFGDKGPVHYDDKRVNTIIDKGLVRELIVQCTKEREGIMVDDYISGVFCDSKNQCHASLSKAIDATCR